MHQLIESLFNNLSSHLPRAGEKNSKDAIGKKKNIVILRFE